MTIGKRIRSIRLAKNLSQADLAKACDLQPSAINHFERDRRCPSAKNLCKLADTLETSVDIILGRI